MRVVLPRECCQQNHTVRSRRLSVVSDWVPATSPTVRVAAWWRTCYPAASSRCTATRLTTRDGYEPSLFGFGSVRFRF